MTTTTAYHTHFAGPEVNHTVQVVGFCNGAAKARRARCSCGWLGVRFAYSPATVKVASEAAEHTTYTS